MSIERDLIFDVIYVVGMSIVAVVNIWAVYSKYRQCMKHLEDRETPAVVRKDIANIMFDAMMAIGWALLLGVSIGSAAREFRGIAAVLVSGVFGFVCLLAVRPLRRLLQRWSDGRQLL